MLNGLDIYIAPPSKGLCKSLYNAVMTVTISDDVFKPTDPKTQQ